MYDYDAIIEDEVLPGCEDEVFVKPLEQLYSLGTLDTSQISGDKIQKKIKTGRTSAAREFTRADVHPTGGSSSFVEAYWNKRYFEVPCEVHKLDLQEAKGKGVQAIVDLLNDAVTDALSDLKGQIFDRCMTQIRADLNASGTYSDAGLTRTTVTTPYNDDVDSTIAVTDLDEAHFGVRFGKKKASGYNWIVEPTVNYTLQNLVGAMHTWNAENDGKAINGGYAPVGRYKNAPVHEMDSMTVGDTFYIPKSHLIFNEHMAMDREQVDPGKYALKWIFRMGVNAHVEKVLQCAWLSNKD